MENADVAASVVYLLTRIETLQVKISGCYRDVGEATREIALINNLLVQLKPVPRAESRISVEERYPHHPAVRPPMPRQPTAESIKGRYPPFQREGATSPSPPGPAPQAPQARTQIPHPLKGRKSLGEILRKKSIG